MEFKIQEQYDELSEIERDAFVSKLIDLIDLNRDEFLRIKACCGNHPGNTAFEEIAGLCERSQQTITQWVPVIAQRDKYQWDAERLNLMELEAKSSPTGISFDYCRHVEDGLVVEKGFRFMRHHHLGPRCETLRDAFDKREQEG